MAFRAEHQADGIFLVQTLSPKPKHPTAAINYSDFDITVSDPLLLKALMKSRYRSGKSHYIFVLLDRAQTGVDAIKQYFCTCDSGARTVGTCSHVMTII